MKFTRPASMNHNDPQLGDTPTVLDAASALTPCRINSKNRRLDSRGALSHAQCGTTNPSNQDSQRPVETARCIRSSTWTRSGSGSATVGRCRSKRATWQPVSIWRAANGVLGMWIEQNEGARFWLGVLTELRNRGLRDALIVCCDGLTGLPEVIGQVWPNA